HRYFNSDVSPPLSSRSCPTPDSHTRLHSGALHVGCKAERRRRKPARPEQNEQWQGPGRRRRKFRSYAAVANPPFSMTKLATWSAPSNQAISLNRTTVNDSTAH